MKQKTPIGSGLSSKAEEVLKSVEDSSIECTGENVRKVIQEIRVCQVELDDRVAERTTELSSANEQLRREMEERERVEQVLAESRAQIVAVVDSTNDLIWSVDPVTFGTVTWNGALRDYFLKSRGIELRAGMTPEQLVPPDFVAIWKAFYSRALLEGSFTTEYRVVNGTIILLLSFNLLRRNGEVFGISIFGKDITEGKRAQEALKESETKFRSYIESAPLAIFVADREGRLVDFNPAATHLLGYDTAALRNMHIRDLHPKEDRGEVLRKFTALLETGHVETEMRMKKRDGQIIWVSLHVVMTSDRLSLGYCQDITERKTVEGRLRQSEERYRALVETSADWVWEVDENANYTYADPKIEKILGYTPEEIIGRTPFQLMPETEARRVRAIFAQIAAKREPFSGLLNINLHRDGRQVILETSGVPIFSHTGEFMGYRGMDRDITEHRLMEEQITATAEQWQTTFDSIQDLVMILDPEFRILRCNAAAVSFFDLPLSRILASRCHSLMHGTDSCVPGCPVEKTLQTGRHKEVEIFHEGRNAWLLVSADPIMDSSGKVLGVVHTAKDISARKQMEGLLQSRLHEIEKLKMQLERENISLRDEAKHLSPHAEIVAQSLSMQQILVQVRQVAPTDSTVLITGETGTGKELIARAIHNLSNRKALPLVIVNCASLPPSLIESELFGREKGAYTGAMSRMVGRFEIANGSTIVLDEIGDLPLEIQAKLLRVLEDRCFERLGSTKSISVNVRIVASTNRDLDQMVQTDKFRKDLYYRLKVFPITIPPLRERPEDIPPLAWSFIRHFEERMGKRIQSIPSRGLEALVHYSWPGNARELRNFIEHAMIVSSRTSLELRPPVLAPQEMLDEGCKLEDLERRHILRVLEETGWRVSVKGGAAEILGLKPTTLEARMKRLGIRRP
jgi:PAS domain S-box-containing protein